ncbi:MAG: flippase-like domain-containing protein [Polyangiaceae bacterium]|nr:flippase-like domain-containing protein [Polyangiaceae bacterium]
MTELNPRATNRWVGLLRRHFTKLLASVVIAVAFWLVLHRGGLPIMPTGVAFDGVTWWACAAYAGSVVLWSFIRAARTRHLLRPIARVPLRDVLTVSWIGFLSIFALPFRIGEVVRPALFQRKGAVSFAAATGACGAERIIDGLVLMGLLGVTLPLGGPLDPLPDHIGKLPIPVVAVPAAAYSALLVFVGAFAAMALFFWRREWARAVTHRVVGLVSVRLANFLSEQVERLSEGFRFLPSPRHLIPYLLETLAYWTVAAAGMWLLAWGCGIDGMTMVRSYALLGVLGLGIIVPGAPGYFGAFQGAIYAGLALYFSESVVMGSGAVYVFFLYVTQLGVMFLMAVVAGIFDRDSRRVAGLGDGEVTAEDSVG